MRENKMKQILDEGKLAVGNGDIYRKPYRGPDDRILRI